MTFTGFDGPTVALLAELPTWGPDRYATERERLRSGLMAPGLELVSELARRLDADLTVNPRSSVSPLHTDLRFAPPGAPRYKDHLLLTTWEGATKAAAPVLWVRIDAARVGFASGVALGPSLRQRWREAVAGPRGEVLAAAVGRLVSTDQAEVAGAEIQRVPRPWPPDHPRAGLLRRTGFQVRIIAPLPPAVVEPHFVDWCLERLGALLPVHRWLSRELA